VKTMQSRWGADRSAELWKTRWDHGSTHSTRNLYPQLVNAEICAACSAHHRVVTRHSSGAELSKCL